MAVKKITRRWIFNSFGVIVFIILAVEVAFAFGISSYYYNYVRETLTTRAEVIDSIFTRYAEDTSVTDFSAQVRNYVAMFSEKNRMELMTIDGEGRIALTSSGFLPDMAEIPDYTDAIANPEQQGSFVGQLGSERVMAVTVLTGASDSSLSAVRLVTSLSGVDQQITMLVLVMGALGVAVLALVLFSSSYFISSIVNPVGEIGLTARRIAQGDFEARLEKRTNDEIGELCDIINHMAEELATAEKLKNDFISSVSHELRTPLTAIQGWAETLLADDGEDKQMLERGMQIIINETGRLSQMVEELLDFSRMQSGRLKLIRSRMDPLAELSEAVLMYTERARREGIELVYEESDIIAPVYGDKNKLRQVFINVLDNAIKYSDSGGIVTVEAWVENKKLCISVRDTGIGIRREDLALVKNKFYKINTTRRGSGIGLAVADEIITRHGGSLSLDSEYGKGTCVTITLPVYTGQDDLAQVDDVANPAQEPEKRLL